MTITLSAPKPVTSILIATLFVMQAGVCRIAAQVPPLPLTKAIQATELPEGAWGAYSRAHAGPCYLADRFPQQLYTFPIVVGQSRVETVRETLVQPDGKKKTTTSEVVLRRRSIGLAPVHGDADDGAQAAPASYPLNRRARAVDADADGYLWTHAITFSAAAPAQHIVGLPDDSGIPQRPADWTPPDPRI